MSATLTSFAGQLGQMLTRETSDATQLADLASVLGIIGVAIRDEEACERIKWLLDDIRYFAVLRAEAEALEQHQYHDSMRRARA